MGLHYIHGLSAGLSARRRRKPGAECAATRHGSSQDARLCEHPEDVSANNREIYASTQDPGAHSTPGRYLWTPKIFVKIKAPTKMTCQNEFAETTKSLHLTLKDLREIPTPHLSTSRRKIHAKISIILTTKGKYTLKVDLPTNKRITQTFKISPQR